MKGFTLLEALVTLGILCVILAMGVPAYQHHVRVSALQEAARLMETRIQERKARAVALGAAAGLCVGQESIQSFEYNPFAAGGVAVGNRLSFTQNFAAPVSLTVTTQSVLPIQNPCAQNETMIALTPDIVPSKDWQGTVALTAGASVWRMTASAGGVLQDGP